MSKVFYGADKKKKVDKDVESVVELTKYKSNGKKIKAYTFAFNDERKQFDILTVTIDSATLESSVELDEARISSEAAAMMEVRKRYSDDFVNKGKRKK
jgi:uncharacterized protein YxeA